jgi:cytochrome c
MIVDNDGNEIQKGGKTGPNLYGILGRTAGTYDGFRYSKDIQAVGEAGLAWTEAEFVTYVQDPTGYLRDYLDDNSARSKMTYRVRKEEDATDIWAYLVSVGPAPDS